MTLDLSNTTVTVYLQEGKPDYDLLQVSLKSKYSNEYLTDGSDTKLTVTPIEWYTNWWKGTFTFATTDYTEKDIAGYYDLELYGDSTLILTKLVKVNNATGIRPNVSYTSPDNENNEQIIYYR